MSYAVAGLRFFSSHYIFSCCQDPLCWECEHRHMADLQCTTYKWGPHARCAAQTRWSPSFTWLRLPPQHASNYRNATLRSDWPQSIRSDLKIVYCFCTCMSERGCVFRLIDHRRHFQTTNKQPLLATRLLPCMDSRKYQLLAVKRLACD